jgi:hypothetical protein
MIIDQKKIEEVGTRVAAKQLSMPSMQGMGFTQSQMEYLKIVMELTASMGYIEGVQDGRKDVLDIVNNNAKEAA